MSGSLRINANMTLTDTTIPSVNQVSGSTSPLTVSTTNSQNSFGIFLVPTTSGGVAIPLGSVSTNGYCQLTNLDTTNYMQVLTAASGTAFLRLNPGETALFRFDAGITAPAWIAHTAAVMVSFMLVQN
jgi:hypothetical protein